MHILDFIMYFVTAFIVWKAIELISGGQWTEEIGSIVGMLIMIVFTIAYIIVFAIAPDWNWSDLNLASIKLHFQW